MTKHAKLSPSGSTMWMNCPGSINLIERLKLKDTGSRYAAEGTVAHIVHDMCLNIGVSAAHYIGKILSSDGHEFTVTDGMAKAVQVSLDYIYNRVDDLREANPLWNVIIKAEKHYSLKHNNVEGLDGGTCDVLIVCEDHEEVREIEIIDYKHGAGTVVEVEGNTQLMQYGVAALYDRHLAMSGLSIPIIITVAQPRAFHPDGKIRSWFTTSQELLDWEENTLVPKAKATIPNDAPLVPSDEACRWCPARHGQCPALNNKMSEIAIAEFAHINAPKPEVVAGSLTTEQKINILNHAALLKSYIKNVEQSVCDEMNSGSKSYDGEFKLVRSKTNRKFTDLAFDDICSPLLDHLERDEMYTEKKCTLTDIEKILKKKLGRVNALNVMGEITIKPEGTLVVVPLDDKRKAATPAIVSDFDHLGD